MPRPRAFRLLDPVQGLAQGVTTRAGGVSQGPHASLNLGHTPGDPAQAVAHNRRLVAGSLEFEHLLLPHQVHGGEVVRVLTPADAGARCDGLSTDRPGLLLGVLGADCPGVLLVDPDRRALAVVHAGWRGVVAGIVPRAIQHMQEAYGSRPGDLLAAIGPGISRARYEVSDEVADRIEAAVPADDVGTVRATGRPGHAHVDLVEAIRCQLASAGVSGTRLETHGACTYEDERFFSHRRDAGVTGRHALVAGWRETDCSDTGA